LAVAIEIPHRHRIRISPRAKRRAGGLGEAARPVAQQDRHVVREIVSDGEVGLAVAVEIPHRHGCRISPRAKRRAGHLHEARRAPPPARPRAPPPPPPPPRRPPPVRPTSRPPAPRPVPRRSPLADFAFSNAYSCFLLLCRRQRQAGGR